MVGSKVATGKMVGGRAEAGGRGVPGPVLSEHHGRRHICGAAQRSAFGSNSDSAFHGNGVTSSRFPFLRL